MFPYTGRCFFRYLHQQTYLLWHWRSNYLTLNFAFLLLTWSANLSFSFRYWFCIFSVLFIPNFYDTINLFSLQIFLSDLLIIFFQSSCGIVCQLESSKCMVCFVGSRIACLQFLFAQSINSVALITKVKIKTVIAFVPCDLDRHLLAAIAFYVFLHILPWLNYQFNFVLISMASHF